MLSSAGARCPHVDGLRETLGPERVMADKLDEGRDLLLGHVEAAQLLDERLALAHRGHSELVAGHPVDGPQPRVHLVGEALGLPLVLEHAGDVLFLHVVLA